MRRRIAAAAAMAALACASVAGAQDRAPAARQALVDLARVLGESHALRQTCQGLADQYWRDRMVQLVKQEAPDQALAIRLSLSFNAGWAAGKASHPKCDPAARAQIAADARKGQTLATGLAGK